MLYTHTHMHHRIVQVAVDDPDALGELLSLAALHTHSKIPTPDTDGSRVEDVRFNCGDEYVARVQLPCNVLTCTMQCRLQLGARRYSRCVAGAHQPNPHERRYDRGSGQGPLVLLPHRRRGAHQIIVGLQQRAVVLGGTLIIFAAISRSTRLMSD